MHPAHGGNRLWAAQLAKCSPTSILDFSASINPLGPPDSAIAAIQNSLEDLVSYPDPNYHHLRAALSQFHGIPADYILPGNGAAELLTWAGRELAEQAVCYLFTPAFGDYQRSLNAFGACIQAIPMGATEPFQPLTQDAFAQALATLRPTAPAGVLLNNPHNPTGQLVATTSIRSLLEQGALVVVDEAFMDFLRPEAQQSVLEWVTDWPNLVVLRSLTKFYSLPGLRLGYAIAHPKRLQRWQHWRDPWSVNTLAAAVGTVVVADQAFQAQTWEWLEQARPSLFKELQGLPGLHPLSGTANFLLVRAEYAVTDLQTKLLQHHQILIRDCLSFPELGDRYFRVAIRTEADNQRLLKALAQVIPSLPLI